MAGEILAGLGLGLHPDKTKVVDLRQGRKGSNASARKVKARTGRNRVGIEDVRELIAEHRLLGTICYPRTG